MDPVETFKFSCPGCGQHLEARPEEAGQIIGCPLCAKSLIIPQAPADRASKLLITAAVAPSRRTHRSTVQEPVAGASSGTSHPRWLYPVLALMVVGMGWAAVLYWRGDRAATGPGAKGPDSTAPGSNSLWTTNFAELELAQRELSGRLRSWAFVGDRPIWRGTKLVLRQRNATPRELGLEVELPLQGGELVAGKRFQVTGKDDALPQPLVISWRDEQEQWQRRSYTRDYILKLEFAEVTPTHVSGRIHVCLDDPDQSWVAGAFQAEVKTKR